MFKKCPSRIKIKSFQEGKVTLQLPEIIETARVMDWSEYRIIARADQKFFPYGNSYISYSHTPPKCRCKAVFFCSHHEIVSMFDTYYKETTAICKFVLKIITTSFIMWQIFVKITVSVKALSLPKQF